MESQPSPSPLLPWEVIERIISHSCDSDKNSQSIRNFSLTCWELRPRSLCFLVADAVFSGRNKIFEFCDFLQANPHLKPFVRSITVHPEDFAPIPLLRILPNLSKIEFTNYPTPNPRTLLNQHVLTSCHLYSTHIQSLSLSSLAFATSVQFFRVLLAFPRITHLVCPSVLISKRSDPVSVYTAKQRLSQRLRLLRLHISYWDSKSLSGQELGYPHSLPAASEFETAGTLLMDAGVIPSTVESLIVELLCKPSRLPQQLDWPRLRSLTLTLRSHDLKATMSYSISLLQNFHDSALKEVTVEVQPDWTFLSVIENIERHPDLYKELEDTLLRFSQAQLVWTMHVTPIRRNSLWLQDLGKHLPLLFQRGALTAIPNKGFCAGHTTSIKIFSISPDSKWAASGSGDNTIILWNTANGAMVHQWTSRVHSKRYTGKGLSSLSFSSDSKYLVSGDDDDGKMAIWNVGGGVLRGLETGTRGVTRCAWSPRGNMLASGCKNGTVKLWDTNTFERLRVFQHATANRIDLIEFSPDGRRLLTGCRLPSCSYYLWNIASSTGKQLRTSIPHSRCMTIAAAFDPGSTRFVIVSPRSEGMVEILDAENVEQGYYVVLGASGSLGGETRGVAFSPDGKMVLTVPNHRVQTHAIRIWDAFTGTKLLSLEGHGHGVSTACFSPCGKYVASASEDGTVRLWRTSDGSCVVTLSEHKVGVGHLVFSPDGKTLCSGAEDGSVIIRQMRDVLPIDEQDA